MYYFLLITWYEQECITFYLLLDMSKNVLLFTYYLIRARMYYLLLITRYEQECNT